MHEELLPLYSVADPEGGWGGSSPPIDVQKKISPLAFVFKRGTEGFNILRVGFTFSKSTK